MKVTRQFKEMNSPPRLTRIAGRLALFALLCGLVPSKALTEPHFWIDNSNGFALGGFDPVSYFTHVAPQFGSEEYEYVWQGVTWRFENKGNQAAFKRNPEVYAPQFGGHGSVALVNGYRTVGHPRIFLISHGKLYLFYSTVNKTAWLEMTKAQRAVAGTTWLEMIR